MTDEEVSTAISIAIDALRTEAPILDFASVHERSTAHRLALHMEDFFRGWNIDCEYDRDENLRKTLQGIEQCRERRTADIVPDIIVHHRQGRGRENNLLVIELKKDAGEDACDRLKLELMTAPGGPYGYQLGLFINIDGGRFEQRWFREGAELRSPLR